jgi:hypothetical protein
MLPRNASAQAKLEFWVGQVNALHRHYSPRSKHDSADPLRTDRR